MKKFTPTYWGLLALSNWIAVVLGCSPEGQTELTLSEKVHHAHSVFVGRVAFLYQDPRFDYTSTGTGSEVFFAEIEVACVYKTPPGFQIPALVNVTDVGNVAGHCHQSRLFMGRKYIILTMNEQHKIMGEEIPATEENLVTATKVCGLQLQNPSGTNAASECRQPADGATCTNVVDYGPDHDHSHMEDHDHDHDGIADHSAEEHGHDHSDESNSSSEEHHGHDHDTDHDHDHDGQPDHTDSEHVDDHDHSHLDDHDHDHDGTADHSDAEHPWDHDHSHTEDHDHDHDGKADHTNEEHFADHDHSHADDHDHDHDGKPDHDASFHDNGVTPDGVAVAAGHSGSNGVVAGSGVLLLLGFLSLHHYLM